jgi:hypothetical protein
VAVTFILCGGPGAVVEIKADAWMQGDGFYND